MVRKREDIINSLLAERRENIAILLHVSHSNDDNRMEIAKKMIQKNIAIRQRLKALNFQ